MIFLWAFTLIHHKSTSWRGILTGLLRSPLCATSTRPVLVSTNSSMYSVSLARLLEIEVAWCLFINCRVILIVIFPFFTILIIILTWWKHLENDFWQLMVQTIVIDRMPQGQSTISVPLLFYSDANWLLLSTTHLWGVRWESAQLGLPCLGTTAITTKIAPGRSGLSPGVQKPDEPQRSGSNRTLCGDTFNWCAP